MRIPNLHLIVFCMFLTCISTAQELKLHHHSIGSSSGSAVISSNVFISNSLGQFSISGSQKNGNSIFLQGFQQFISSFNPKINSEEDTPDILLYPNPFISRIQIILPEILSNFKIAISNSSGTNVFTKEINTPTKTFEITPRYLPTGSYVLSINTGNVNYQKIILKR